MSDSTARDSVNAMAKTLRYYAEENNVTAITDAMDNMKNIVSPELLASAIIVAITGNKRVHSDHY